MKLGRLILLASVVVVAVVAALALLPDNGPEQEAPPVSKVAPAVEGDVSEEREETSRPPVNAPIETSKPSTGVGEASPPQAAPSSLAEADEEPLEEFVSQESEVEWDEEPKHPKLDSSRLSESQRQAVQSSPVPVLLPDRDDLLRTAIISTGDYFYAAEMKENEVTVVVSGASKVVKVPGSDYEPPAFGDHELTLSRPDGILEMNFKAYGVYYDITVECADLNDPRCAQDAYALDLADNLMKAEADKR